MITPEDRATYPSYTDKSILGIKLIGGLQNQILRDYINNKSDVKAAIRLLMGPKTNPNWVDARIANEMYLRDMVDETEHDKLTR